MPNIYFPYLNLSFHIDQVAFTVFGIPIYWYGIILTSGILLGLAISMYIAKKEGVSPDHIFDFLLYDIVFAIIGARTYFVAFNWEYYSQHLGEIFNLRQGGIAIYGAIIASFIVAVIYTRMKHINLWQFGDIAAYGLLVGQAIGRYGNFVNKEAFGDYTDNLFAMQIMRDEAATSITQTMLDNAVIRNGVEFIQVHPTFLYESCWNFVLLIILLIYRKYKKAHGEIFFLYIAGYGVGRLWIEGLRTDQLVVPGINIAASQIVAVFSIVAGIIGIIWCRNKSKIKFKKM
ncbi:prolipoprotein diacylglyceryl transferase [Niameybacter massiliensis]|uniref:Phosphatidylglycerol--prolipoprotein diacylglyceryl transferase n=1 Tax=Holtiella tumoricola TaxID=3018743 RepID=A0AA42DP26_9FIRM|nr:MULTISPECIES: prolipoprotein diacylglyceryl transferase [Lachnospirales]MDA3732462.1 prolipoprotein diacylglyceryl transferase [Holtiella tumoricola]